MKRTQFLPLLIIMMATSIGTFKLFDKLAGSPSQTPSSQSPAVAVVQPSQPLQVQSIASSRSSWQRSSNAKTHHWAAPLASRLNAAPSEAEYIATPMEESIASSAEPVLAELPAWPNEHKVNLFALNMKILPTQDVASISLEQELPFNDYNKHWQLPVSRALFLQK